jgi:natural product precursor
MKKIKKLKLSELSKRELEDRDMKALKGGNFCQSNCGTISPTLESSSGFWRQYFYG